MEVYIVVWETHKDWKIDKVFSTEGNALEYLKNKPASYYYLRASLN